MTKSILVINSGSSSIKFSIYACLSSMPRDMESRSSALSGVVDTASMLRDVDVTNLLYHGEIERILQAPCLTIFDANHKQIKKQRIPSIGPKASFQSLLDWFERLPCGMTLKAAGHRIVHGGQYFIQPTLVTDEVLKKIAKLIPLAPHHQPENLEAIQIIKSIYPDMPQVACFDTTFHRTQEKLATRFAIPKKLTDEGLIRYGFHGISYEYIASVINQHIGNIGDKRVIVAHLGNGASLCAMHQRKSVATSMGLTALDGLMMGTRCGTIDPGVLLYLLQEKKWPVEHVSTLLYKESGLSGVSGISSDMRELQSSTDPSAIEAVDLFCFIAVRELTALCGVLQGCDAIVFTAGIGENSGIVRKKICERLNWLGVMLDEKANTSNASIISQEKSTIVVSVIPTNEEYMIAKHTMDIITGDPF